MKRFLLILLLFIATLYISLPNEFPIKWDWGKVHIDWHVVKPSRLGKIPELTLGLDISGGSRLVFEADTSNLGNVDKKEALNGLKNVMERRVNLFGVSEPNVQLSNFAGKDRVIVELSGIKDLDKAISVIGTTAQLQFVEIVGEGEEAQIKETDLTGADLSKATLVFDQNNGKPAVSIEFSSDGAKKFEDLTGRNVGKALPILLDQVPISSPVVSEKIIGGKAQITGTFTVDEAKNLVTELNAGALPIPVKLIEQEVVGPSLGAESIHKSIVAGLVGIGGVFVFMILSYRGLGIVANTGLIIFALITLSLYKMFGIVLTLPGIAGFLLSVGMAVDSNILIFERFREEKGQRNIKDALEVSFGKAWDSIRDANVATLVACFILANPLDLNFLNTSGPVRGFAITLALGVLISLFTGIVISRNLLRVFVRDNMQKKLQR